MKKTKIGLGRKLILSKENISSLDGNSQLAIKGGASVNICAETDICPVIKTKICPVIPSAGCVTHKHTWCWVAGGSCQ
ncbi:class I lanthipeptide [Taibaiella koreensis]|uniref:class I lanthipeptide n=1 Tax=Taibaiella koreensis TaxID=1268548 RepID=UPI000E59EB66|nr:class I lanthipeptide [Taibaiella koreensis]